jgi:Nuclease-related domain/UvrD-like helicase C-terminal domain/AAA domain
VARMIPPSIPPSCLSPGEREIFARLKDEPGAQDWIVLHSLDIAHHLRQVAGEADFVVIAPNLGVLCLEVKACHSLQRKDGLWYYGRDPHGDPRGPFKQSSEAMHSLRQQVVRSDPALSHVPFWSAVAFPYIDFAVTSDEWHSWQVIDAPRFRRQPLSTLIRSILRSARSYLSSQPSSAWFHEADQIPNQQQAAAIARILRPSFEFAEKAPDRRTRQQAEILRYTEEQFVALDTMADNDRVLFTGPAGTGKTVLAVEAARRAANTGNHVLFLCYNRLLGRWLSQQPILHEKALTVGTFHQYLLGVAGIAPPTDAADSFWRVQLPENASMRLLDGHPDLGRFDTLIVDEFQDLLEPVFLDILDIVLQGGLNAGRWLMLGDFERQMLYGQNRDRADELVRMRLGSFARCSLRVNCRNTPRIATLSHLLGKLTPNYSRILRPDDRIEPLITYYATPSQQRKELASVLDRLQRESFSSDDIVILSPKAGSRCAAASLTAEPWRDRLVAIDQVGRGRIPFTTIQSFKGLESPAIVVTDIEHLDSELFSSLFYVATTRALERLCIIVHETAKPDIITALLGNSKERT